MKGYLLALILKFILILTNYLYKVSIHVYKGIFDKSTFWKNFT